MAIRYYDDIIIKKLNHWMPEASNIRVLHPDESKKLFELTADDNKDEAMKLPIIALSRKPDLELLSTVKSPKSYDGLRILPDNYISDFSTFKGKEYFQKRSEAADGLHQINVLPIRPEYQLDIYTKTAEEGEEYLRSFLFKLINNPTLVMEIPYNDMRLEHIAYIRVLNQVSNTSAITERLFSGQFTRWTIQFELHDAFLFSIPYRRNWELKVDGVEASDNTSTAGVLI